ncbi:hypothetical protein B0H34DRAFT_297343 [Crassisporium funariophilum]|nr:hypothetical protein B0H34DRAFT_297343 [Crassisporium funariophilum]
MGHGRNDWQCYVLKVLQISSSDNPFGTPIISSSYSPSIMMGKVTHIVSVKFPSTPSTLGTEKCKKEDGSEYILSITGGPDISIEGLQKGYNHIYVVQFSSIEDRDFYVKHDVAHAEFAKRLVGAAEGGIDGVAVLDFEVSFGV